MTGNLFSHQALDWFMRPVSLLWAIHWHHNRTLGQKHSWRALKCRACHLHIAGFTYRHFHGTSMAFAPMISCCPSQDVGRLGSLRNPRRSHTQAPAKNDLAEQSESPKSSFALLQSFFFWKRTPHCFRDSQ